MVTYRVSNFHQIKNKEEADLLQENHLAHQSNTDHLFDFPPNNNAGDRQILPDEPMYPGGKPVHFSKTERRGNQIKHSSFSIHPGAGTARVSMKAHVSSHHGNNRQSQQSSFSFTDPQSQDFFNWPLPPQRDDRLGFYLFHGSQMDNSLHGNGIHSGVPPPPNRGRSPLDVPPPPPPKSIEHRLYLENENLSPSHIDILRPKPVQVNKSTRKKVSQHTLDMIRAWFTGGHTPLDVHYTDRFVLGKDSTVHNGGKPIDTRYPPNKVSNTDALFNLPDNGAMPQEKPVTRNTDSLFNIPNTASTPHDLPGNTDHLFNLPDAGTTGQHGLSGNTDNLFNLPTGGSGPRDLHGNTGHLFDLSSVSEVSGGSHNLSPKNKIPVNGNTDHLFDHTPIYARRPIK
ncbi:hypothetical protein KUTeg_012748 [Tegillarca granosa]|uniref:Uncharacterized protein n=1 Tax=Tegillarca granosa TaxID=220873 RepID=A0ABQ9F0F4_TEGGR|nr:hypothetical protein KUTeg_012748 [Tegillarca granosa]